MKKLISTLIVVCVLAGLGAGATMRVSAMSLANKNASALQKVWMHDEQLGISRTSFTTLQRQLSADQQTMRGGIFTIDWWTSPVPTSMTTLKTDTTHIWNLTLKQDQLMAEKQIAILAQLEKTNTQWLTVVKAPTIASWNADLKAATTPRAAASLASAWSTNLSTLQSQITTVKNQAQVAAAEGASGVLGTATRLLKDASGMNLSTGDLGTLAATYTAELASGSTNAEATAAQLVTREQQVEATVALNNTLFTTNYAVEILVDQAEAEGTTGSAAEATSYAALASQYTAAQTLAALSALQSQYVILQTTVQTDLSANVCGHASSDVPASGQGITISLSLQEMVFYDNGCVVNATPVSTGMPGRRTPTGSYHVYDKITPFEMVSSDPTSSPFWYPPTLVTWVMGFDGPGMSAGEGYFIHNAYWEPNGVYGPGSENGPDASHGCIHTPHAVMQWAFSWTNIGTPVTITA